MLAGVETGTHMFPYLDSTPFEGTVEILLANFLPICMVHELQCHLQERYCKKHGLYNGNVSSSLL
jgi:hypothetical protein